MIRKLCESCGKDNHDFSICKAVIYKITFIIIKIHMKFFYIFVLYITYGIINNKSIFLIKDSYNF